MASPAAGAGRPYRSALRQERARRTRRQVLDAARDAFVVHGFAGTTMGSIAAGAGVSVPTVEALFGTKAAVLKAAIDVAIAGDDEQVPVLDREWADRARRAPTVEEMLRVAVAVLGPAQHRSAGLILAAFEAPATEVELAGVAAQLVEQRERTAEWFVDRIADVSTLRPDLSRRDAVETVWLLMDPAVFVRLTRHRQWTLQRYEDWVARSMRLLLTADHARLHDHARPHDHAREPDPSRRARDEH